MNRIVEWQTGLNARSVDGWIAYADHRRRMTALLAAGARHEPRRLCVIGAGNCNDIDLASLGSAYDEIHLVDLDGAALASGVARQDGAPSGAIRCHGGVDVTGVADVMAGWDPDSAVADTDLAACAEWPVQVARSLPGPFGMTASTCLLSQIVGAAAQSIGEQHPRFLETIQALRLGHLRMLTSLTARGGDMLLVTDFVSSETVPQLASADHATLPGLLTRAVEQKNFFHGTNPAALMATVRGDPALSQMHLTETIGPWRWDLGLRSYGVYALRYRHAPPHA
jgi:hypothetical protein